MSTVEEAAGLAPPAIARTPIVEKTLREAITDSNKRKAIASEVGWDVSMISKVLSGDTGITLERLGKLFRVLGLVVTTEAYMDYLAEGNMIGSNCVCARMSMGACGKAA